MIAHDDFSMFCLKALGTSSESVRKKLLHWCEEDLNEGDLTVKALHRFADTAVTYKIVAKEDVIICGLPIAREMIRVLSDSIPFSFHSEFKEGDKVTKGQVVFEGTGKAAVLWAVERTLLNLVSKMSGISTFTYRIQKKFNEVAKKAPELLETRKTTPGLRIFEKYATRVGGARNHRMSLSSAAMIKENHLRCVQSNVTNAVNEIHQFLPALGAFEIEVNTLDQFEEACRGHAQLVMCDHFKPEDLKKAVDIRNKKYPHTKIEVSGNMDRVSVEDICSWGVDYVSMGALIHQATWVDLSMQVYPK